MEIILEGLLEQIVPIVITAVSTAIIAGIGMLIKYLGSRTRNETLRQYLGVISGIAFQNVHAMMQLKVNDLKLEGRFSPEIASKVKQHTMDLVLEQTPDKVLKYLERHEMNIEGYVGTVIEASLAALKERGKNGV